MTSAGQQLINQLNSLEKCVLGIKSDIQAVQGHLNIIEKSFRMKIQSSAK